MKTRLHTRQTTFRQLEIFKVVAERLSVTEAAHQLHLAQPTVSTQLAKLSEALNSKLFEQIGKKLYLTDVGEELLRASRELFEVLDRLEMRLAQRAGLSVGRLRLGVVTTAKYLVPAPLGAFCRQHPQVDVEFQVGNRADIKQRLQQNLDDLYVFSHPPSDLDIDATPLTDNPLVVIAPRDHGLVGRGELPWSALAGERLLMRELGSGTRHAIEQHAQSSGLALGQIITIASNEAIKESVAAGLGLAILSRLALTHMAPGNLVELPVQGFPIANRWYLVTAKGKQLSPIAQAFKDFLMQHCVQQ
ncbi:LysR family transcriptional regulator [Paucibacter sp. TC2R-5]|uniref:LysR family transcriptional regulator n=1 Tax=Paucibacter sp. TC2R-5 TaxID=2893555 RepID=UPI0021E35D5A|nr:LysR family transcriptional regulator [Paucibacter sp. TC2R-5]MCV2359813.1 LysR family transcriptional regulator [Paucibacter sp. TC2R-5]